MQKKLAATAWEKLIAFLIFFLSLITPNVYLVYFARVLYLLAYFASSYISVTEPSIGTVPK